MDTLITVLILLVVGYLGFVIGVIAERKDKK